MGEPTYQTFGNIEDETSASNNNNSGEGVQPTNSFPGLNFLNPEPVNNNNNNFLNNFQEKEKPKEKKSGFSFLNKKPKKSNNNLNNLNNDSTNSAPFIANKTPLSSSMSDNALEKSGNQKVNQGYSNMNETPKENENNTNNDSTNLNNEYEGYMDMNNNMNEIPKPKQEEEPKETELNENSIKSKFNIKKNGFINDYIKYINELHSKKLALQNKESDLSLLNVQKENLMKEEQKAIDDNDYEKADNIENKIKEIKNKASETLLKIEEETHSLMSIKKKEIEINNSLLLDINEVTTGYNILKNKMEEKIEKFTNNELAKHEGENIRLEKLNEKLQFLKNNLEQDKNIISDEEVKINNLIKGQKEVTRKRKRIRQIEHKNR